MYTFVLNNCIMSSQFFVGLVIVCYILVVGGLFVIEYIKGKRGGNTNGH